MNMNQNTNIESDAQDFLQHYHGCFTNMLRWPQLEQLWQVVAQQQKSWYLYTTNKPAPVSYATHDELVAYIKQVDLQIREQHKYDYCGIVYADEPESPSLIKIYHPKNLGASCGSSGNKPIPGWILSTIKPVDLIIEQDKTDTSNWNRFTQFMKFGQQ
ncbi:hypothetical protein MNBD_GAMMA22-28 [hydrothermal vent metagenome]|uniref:Uncharacterized protein n=1 Tax=hydrothermal vent metagenome TaxID=652676 RepID=A0A3B0ZPB0_9ZZZZ